MSGQIRRIYLSETDRHNLSVLRVETGKDPGFFSYEGVVVNKPWGYEYLMFENQFVAIWILFLKKSHATSMHCHPKKKTSLVVIDGKVTCSTLEGWYDPTPLQGLMIEKGVFHSTQANSSRGAWIMEVETPPLKEDLARLKDEYGRAGKAYEGEDKITRNLKNYDYIDFHKCSVKSPDVKKLRRCSFCICNKTQLLTSVTSKSRYTRGLVCLLQGNVTTPSGTIILDVGEIMAYDKLISYDKELVSKNAQFLVIVR